MAANGSVEEQGAAGDLNDISAKIKLNGAKATLSGSVFNTLDANDIMNDHLNPDALVSRLAATGAPWITNNNKNKVIASSAAPLTFCSQDDPRRTLRIDRSGSTESVVTTSGGDSSSSEPGSPSRPVTPQMTMAPVPTYECLRADSEDSGLGPSPAKSLTSPTSPEGSVSPIRFDDRSDSLLDLSPRTDNSDDLLLSEENNGCCDDCEQTSTAIPKLSPTGGSSFQFLLASKNSIVNTNEAEDFCIHFPTRETNSEELEEDRTHFDEHPDEELQPHSPLETFNTAQCSDALSVECVSRVESIPQNYVQDSLLNPKVVLIRSDFGGQYTEESCSQQSSSAGTAAGEDTTVDCPPADDGACKWLNCDRSADANTTVTDLIDHIRQCHVQNHPEDAESFACLWVGCKVYSRPSCSRSWLERHVLLHGGSKPFRCIVAGCRQRFGTEVALQRHVNSHFPQAGRHPNHPHQHRLARSRRRHYKHRRKPQSHKSKDFIDDATMERLHYNLWELSSIEGMDIGGPPSAITFRSVVRGNRRNCAGKISLLLHWTPENMLPDTWIPAEELPLNFEKTIPVSRLPPEALEQPSMEPFSSAGIVSSPGKRKRK